MDTPEPPRSWVMGLLNGARVAQTVSAAARFDVPDLLEQHGARTARELVEVHGVPAQVELLQRLLRACAAIGIFSEDADGRFGPTDRSAVLTRAHPSSVKHFAELYGSDWWRDWGRLHDTVRAGQPAPAPWGTTDVTAVERFGQAMRSRIPTLRPLLAQCELGAARTLVDVGGGFGHVAMELLRTRPALRACVVDLPQVIAIAERRAASDCPAEIRERLSFVGGDMFEALPEGDAYLLSGILHDWDDASCSRILERCAARLPEGGRLVCLDCVLPPLGDVTGSALKLLDLQMMVGLPGKERTEPEWRVLCRSAGFEIERIVHPEPRNGPSLLEAVRT